MYGPREFGIDMFFFFEQNSGQVRYVQMWSQFCSIEEKGLCPSMVLREFCNLEAWPKRRLLEVGWFAGRGCVPVYRQCVRHSVEEPLKLFSTRPRCYMLLNPIFFEDWSFPGKSRFDYWFLMEIFLFYFFGWQWPGWHIQWDLVSPKTVPTGYLSQV